ncbi:MAG: hypothetical protein ABSG75_07135 [Syntrophales bacterium]|jgi:hypothetical protein
MANEKSGSESAHLSRLCGLLEKKITIFKDFISATVSLKDMMKEHNVDAIEIMIARRHDHIVFINRIDDEIRMVRDANPSDEAMLNPEARKRLQSLMKMVENLISKTLRLNQDCEATAEDELHKLRQGLSRLGHREKWFKGYGGKSWEPRFLDVKT